MWGGGIRFALILATVVIEVKNMRKQQTILVVDDDALTREMLKIILEKAGYKVLLAEDGETAFEMTTAARPDLVITDGLLPKMHGFMLSKTIKSLDNPP